MFFKLFRSKWTRKVSWFIARVMLLSYTRPVKQVKMANLSRLLCTQLYQNKKNHIFGLPALILMNRRLNLGSF